jgi:DeoR/GlpR family transcriptional regulator of sugar metabolism
MLGEARRAAIIDMLRANGAVTVNEVQQALAVSTMTVRRDLAELARRGIAVRTHGGAVMPSISAHEDSFAKRLEAEAAAKAALARSAVELLSPRDAVFLDSSTTCYHLARQVIELGLELTIITNSLPVTQLIATQAAPGIELISVGGMLRAVSQSFVGPTAVRAVEDHFADHAFLSIKALAPDGVLADADPLEAEVKRAMIGQAREPVLLVDHSKLTARGLNAIGPLSRMALVLAHGLHEADLRALRKLGTPVRVVADGDAGAPTHAF